jgi:hypothetical protein
VTRGPGPSLCLSLSWEPTVTTALSACPEVDDRSFVSAVNTPSLNKFLPASNLKPGTHLKTPDGQAAVVVGGSVPAVHDGWMWDLTVPGNNDHDFYVVAGSTSVLVHNCGGLMPDPNGAHAVTCECEGTGQNITYEQDAPSASQPTSQFTGHALQRLAQRGVSPEQAQSILDSANPFSYYHDDQWKTGYYDPSSKIFIATTIDGNINTVMTNVAQAYINRLLGG